MITTNADSPAATTLARRCLVTGALLMLLAVMLGAFGTHVLQAQLAPRQLASFQTGVSYHVYHALALLLIGCIAQVTPSSRWLPRAAALMLFGIACFSGSIYAMTFGAPRWLGMVAPVGGVSFMLGWVAVGLHVKKVKSG